MTCGIYKIENKINGKVYIGQSVNISKRWRDHKENGQNINSREKHKPLYRAMYLYGLDNFDFIIIEECNQKELNDKEIYWIKYYNSLVPNGYNITPGGNAPIFYNYDEILEFWNKGYLCKELEEIFNCGDDVIHNALISKGISQEEIYNRSQKSNKKAIIALDLNKKPLKKFDSITQAEKFFNNNKLNKKIGEAIKNKWKAYGYYWEYLNNNNIPKIKLNDEEFLLFQSKFFSRTKEEKENLSFKNRIIERPSREELKQLIRTNSFVAIGNKFSVSDNAIRKWCDFYNLPRHKREINKISDENWKLI